MSEQTTAGSQRYTFSFYGPDRLGVLAKVTGLFYDCGAYMEEISSYIDPQPQRIFYRCVFNDHSLKISLEAFKQRIADWAQQHAIHYQLRAQKKKYRVLIAVSKYDHCLNALLAKWKAGVLPVEIVGVVSNHKDCCSLVEWFGLRYWHLPISAQTKPMQERQLLTLIEEEGVELLVLARYMQILSDRFCSELAGRAINIHHSFLPGFKGARPYHQAYDRGVKVMGATAHYVNSDLDEGPIIVQEVKAIDHELSAEQMVSLGHDVEATALAQAVKLHVEMRVILNGQRTVIL